MARYYIPGKKKLWDSAFFVTGEIAFIWLLVAVFLYPAVHESGHIMAACLLGGKIARISWVPSPYVLCEFNHADGTGAAITGLAGMVLPMAVTALLTKTRGLVRLGALFLNVLTGLSQLIGLAVVLLRMEGIRIANDDITVFIDYTGWVLPALLIMVILLSVSFWQMSLLNPKKTVLAILNRCI